MTGNGDFFEGVDSFIAMIEGETLTSVVEVDQIYAHYQHEHPEFYHPSGGEAFYLTTPLFAKATRYMPEIASKAITPAGPMLLAAMKNNAESLSMEVYERAPWEFADLRASGHPYVMADGAIIWDRPPNCRRLSAEDLRIKSELSYLLDPHRYKRG